MTVLLGVALGLLGVELIDAIRAAARTWGPNRRSTTGKMFNSRTILSFEKKETR